MIHMIFNLIGGFAVLFGLYNMFDSMLIAILGTVILNGAPWFWMFHSIWYVFLELYIYGSLTANGYIALGSYLLVMLLSFGEVMLKRKKL